MTKIISFQSVGEINKSKFIQALSKNLFLENKKVLLIDWNPTSPSLHKLLDINLENTKKDLFYFFKKYKTDFGPYLKENEVVIPTQKDFYTIQEDLFGKIDFISIAKDKSEFFKFDFFDFFDNYYGAMFCGFLKESLKNLNYDYILIDCQNGNSNFNGIVSVIFPDVNILFTDILFLEETKNKIDKILEQEYTKKEYPNKLIIPVLVDESDSENQNLFEKTFKNFKTFKLFFNWTFKEGNLIKIKIKNFINLLTNTQ